MPSQGSPSRSQAPRRSSVDYSRARRGFQGKPLNYVSFGVVGHYDQNPAFARVENDKVLVEVTLLPGGDEIIAELGMEGQGSGFSFYIPLQIGCRVLVAYPQGEEDPVIIKRLTDREFPFAADVAGVTTAGAATNPLTGSSAAPQFAFLQTPGGVMLAIETGDDGDIVVRSGGDVMIEVDPGQAIHLNGRTHIGSGFASPPQGASTGPSGEIIPGVGAGTYIPAPHVPVPLVPTPLVALPGTPDDGVLRIKDAIQSDITVDPALWAWIIAVHAFLIALNNVWNPLATGGGGPFVVPSGAAIPVPPNPPVAIGSRAKSASKSTCGD